MLNKFFFMACAVASAQAIISVLGLDRVRCLRFTNVLHLISYIMYVLCCAGHHDSDRMTVLLMVSQAESIVF